MSRLFFFVFGVLKARRPELCMTINEFIGLSFYGASTALKKVFGPGRIDGYGFKVDDNLKKKLDLTDAAWGPLDRDGTNNVNIQIRDKWAVTRLRVILSIKYNKDIMINYHIGNTSDSCTLKEISFSGVGRYWESEFPDLAKIGVSTSVHYVIPETFYGNGRKGTVQDFLNKKWGLEKVNLDLCIAEADRILTDGTFVDAWKKWEDYKSPERVLSRSKMNGCFGDYLVKIMTDPDRPGLDKEALLMKVAGGLFREYPTARTCEKFFSTSRRQHIKNIKGDLDSLSREIARHLELDTKMNELNDLVMVEYEKTLQNFMTLNPDLGLTLQEVKKIIGLSSDVDVEYQYVKAQ